MEVRLLFVPPGGGETDYSLDIDLPSSPQPGDYVSVWRPEHSGTADFIVRRTWWYLEQPEGSNRGTVNRISVEAEYARGPNSSEEHLHAYRRYHAQTGEERRFGECVLKRAKVAEEPREQPEGEWRSWWQKMFGE